MPIPTSPSGQPMPQKQLPNGYYRDQQGRVFDNAGRQVDPISLRPIPGGAQSGAIGPQAAPRSPITPPTNPQQTAPVQPTPPLGAPPPNPGPSHYTDKYGAGNRNTNAAGVQSNGDDDPWLIGAFQGGTYDEKTLVNWIQRAHNGDGGASWLLRQIDLSPQDLADGTFDSWAKRRNLTPRDQAFAPGGQYGQGAAQRNIAPTNAAVARDQGNQEQYPGTGPGPLYDNNGVASHTPPASEGQDQPPSYMPDYPTNTATQQGGSRGRDLNGYMDPATIADTMGSGQQGNTSKPSVTDDPQAVPDAPQAQSKKLVNPYFNWGGSL